MKTSRLIFSHCDQYNTVLLCGPRLRDLSLENFLTVATVPSKQNCTYMEEFLCSVNKSPCGLSDLTDLPYLTA